MDIEGFLASWASIVASLGTLMLGIAALLEALRKWKKNFSFPKVLAIVGVLLIAASVLIFSGRVIVGSKPPKIPSPDGTRYAQEIDPIGYGYIGIFEFSNNRMERMIKVLQHPAGEFENDLKDLVWSPDSRWIAVMYHHNGGGHISIIDVETGIEIKYIPISKWYHHIEFSSDGTKIIADGDTLEIS